MFELIEDESPRDRLIREARENLLFSYENGGHDTTQENLAARINERIGTSWDKKAVGSFILRDWNPVSLTAGQIKDLHTLSTELKTEIGHNLITGQKPRVSVKFKTAVQTVELEIGLTPDQSAFIESHPELRDSIERAVRGAVAAQLDMFTLATSAKLG